MSDFEDVYIEEGIKIISWNPLLDVHTLQCKFI